MNSIFIKEKSIKLSYFFENNKFEIKLNYNFNYKSNILFGDWGFGLNDFINKII